MDPIPLEAQAFGFFRKHKTGKGRSIPLAENCIYCEGSMSCSRINSSSSSITNFLLD